MLASVFKQLKWMVPTYVVLLVVARLTTMGFPFAGIEPPSDEVTLVQQLVVDTNEALGGQELDPPDGIFPE
ncbi:hypothetical protein O1611_g9205 [Lasiodiplodia mahajangana]|uniref:Uncharacterized protein n=1 Tax=Lasiodiplodia mahajangana TaxID=1108764 RepID=A0ACC2JAM8_9PEZI|nr:hypothetical protein O1611_g9205 [Lasiodiplodia mahajangana]